MRRTKWIISIRSHVAHKQFIIRSLEGESPVEAFKRVYAKVKELEKKYEGRGVTVDLISRSVAFKPKEGVKKPKGHLWCSYCRKYRFFVENELGTRNCMICGVSDNEFHIKTHNKLWDHE